jgi:DNA helicase-2/ATP-dependent DNA helicase PcrA
MDLLSEFGHHLGLSSDIEKVSEHRLWRYLKRGIGELKESDLLDTNQPDRVYRDLQAFISRAKDELLPPDEIIARAESKLAKIPADESDDAILAREKWQRVLEAGKIYKSYERIKSEEGGGIDYGDMIVLCHRLLSQSKVAAAEIRKRLRFVLVDEFQDANFAQVEILRLLAGPNCGVTAVGDDDQAIYRFRGASFASFRLFQKLFPGHRVFRLEDNYRSQGNIVRAAQVLIEIDPAARFDPGKKMAPVTPAAANIIVRKCPDDFTEAASVADQIEKLLQEERCRRPKSIAVLIRLRRHKDILVKALERKGIDYFYDRRTAEIQSRQARLLVALHEFVSDPDRADLLPLLVSHFVPTLRPETEREINYRLNREDGPPLEILSRAAGELGGASPGIGSLIEMLRRLIGFSRDNEPLPLLEKIIVETGILKGVIAKGKIADADALREVAEVLRAAEQFGQEYPNSTHADFTEYFAWRETFGSDNEGDIETESPVVIQTVHGSKGLEYPVVFIIGCSGRKFPPQKQHAILEFPSELYKEDLPPGDYRIQEERRLFYVGMTRAREMLYLYGVEKKGTKISQFVAELEKSAAFKAVADIEKVEPVESLPQLVVGPALVSQDPTAGIIIPVIEPVEKALPEGLLELWRKRVTGSGSAEDFEERKDDFISSVEKGVESLKTILASEQFSPKEKPRKIEFETVSYSDLESFLACPLQFYFAKVLRLPTPTIPQATLGSVIHAVLQEAGEALKERRVLNLDDMKASFERQWAGISLPDPDRKERLRSRGLEILERFMRMQSERPGRPIELERKFAIPLRETGDKDSPKLVGRIDRIDATPEGFELIDYKTGKQSSADLKGDMQMPIYALACKSLLGQYPARMTYMFLGDDSEYHQQLGDEQIESTRGEIAALVEKINASDFAATPGQPCRTCAYARICPAKKEKG